MIYAINKVTKEHRVYHHPMEVDFWAECELVQADDDGWIPWYGGECPLPSGQPCEAKTRSGDFVKFNAAGHVIGWKKAIAYYRPILDEPEAPEWLRAGAMVAVHNEPGHGISYGEELLGQDVEIKALFQSGDVGMAAVECDGQCFCFRVDMLRPIRSAEDRAVDEMLEQVETIHGAPMPRECARALYRAGYRKEESK